MKKNVLISCLLIASAFFYCSCQNHSCETKNKSADSFEADFRKLISLKPLLATGNYSSVQTALGYKDSLFHTRGKDTIGNYSPGALRDPNSLFTIDSGELRSYLAVATQNGYPNYHMQFLLGYNTATELNLIITCIDTLGDDIYSQFQQGSANVLKLVAKHTKPDPLENPTTTVGTMPRYRNGVTVASAKNMINNYIGAVSNIQLSQGDNQIGVLKTANSLAVEADFFFLYVQRANMAGAVTYEIYLAADNNRLTLVIAPVDVTGKHLYFKNGSNDACVYEHFDPCPTCDYIYNQGTTIE